MKLALIIEPAAEEDIFIGYQWYEERKFGLGTKFLEALETLFDQIIENPRLYLESIPGVRRSVTRTFLLICTQNCPQTLNPGYVVIGAGSLLI